MLADVPSSYDEIPYGDCVHAATHPDNLACVATLSGLSPAPPQLCRVLELGCGSGANLISMALSLPESQFVGVERSREEAARARQTIAALGLKNVEVWAQDLMDFEGRPDFFDYVLAHGVYSWVPQAVRDRILQICSRHLAPRGIAYVSYNTLPGWHLRGTVREMLSYHVRGITSNPERVKQCRALLKLLPEAFPDPNYPYASLLTRETDLLQQKSDGYLFHEHLEEDNHALYFRDFLQHARCHGLQYVDDARPGAFEEALTADVRERLSEFSGDRVEREQYLDFLQCRTFRRSLLTHQHAHVDRTHRPEALMSLQLVGKLFPVSDQADLTSDRAAELQSAQGKSIQTNDPVLKTALGLLSGIVPRGLPFSTLWAETAKRLSLEQNSEAEQSTLRNTLAGMLRRLYANDLVELHLHQPPFVVRVSEKPCASPLARHWARDLARPIINLRQRHVILTPFQRTLMGMLEGKQDVRSLFQNLLQLSEVGPRKRETDHTPPQQTRQEQALVIWEELHASLKHFAVNALLVG